MAIAYLILAALIMLFWLSRALSPSSRMAPRFAYDSAGSPAVFHGTIPRDPTPPTYAGDPPLAAWPVVTILVPGRNEGHVLAATLGSICAMDYPDFRVVFIDDQSTDDTAAVCRDLQTKYPHLRVIHNTTPPPPGWVGKSWAIHQARSEMTGDYLLFADSDLSFHRSCLRQMIRLALHRQTDLASLLPQTDCHTLGERFGIIAALQLIALAFPLRKSNDPRWPKCIVAGGFMLFRRTAYDALGGHEAVRGHMIEDVALGTLAKTRGLSVFTVGTRELLRGRMYEGTADTFHGLKKNAYAAANHNLVLAAAFILALLLVGVLLPVYPLVGIVWWITSPAINSFLACLLGIFIWSLMLHTITRANRLVAFPDYLAWLTPAAAAFFLVVFIASVLDYYRGGAVWSGRTYHPDHVTALNSLPSPPAPPDPAVAATKAPPA